MDTVAHLVPLLDTLPALAHTSPLRAVDNLDTLRRHLPHLPTDFNPTILVTTLLELLSAHPSNLLLSHRAVSLLAHPVLSTPSPKQLPILIAMDRLSNSAAFQHTAMAALQNAASSAPMDRDAVLLAVVSAMRSHHLHSGILLRGADLIAYHLNQPVSSCLSSTFRLASRIVVDVCPRLAATPQGASTALLALVAAARHASSIAQISGRSSSTTRFSRTSPTTSNLVDTMFAAAITAAMGRHPTYAPVQVLGCEVVRVATAGMSVTARAAAKELLAAGAISAVLAALQTLMHETSVVDMGLVALRSILLGGGVGGRGIKPGLNVDEAVGEKVIKVVAEVSDGVGVKDRDLSSVAAVLGMDVRMAFWGGKRERGAWRRMLRRLRGEKEELVGVKERGRGRVGGRSSFSVGRGDTAGYGRSRVGSGGMKEERRGPAASARIERVGRKEEGMEQISLNRRWRSVSGRWNGRGRRGSSTGIENGVRGMTRPHTAATTTTTTATTSGATGAMTGNVTGRRERRGPLTLSGSEMANLTRQPSRVFTTAGEGHGGVRIGGESRMQAKHMGGKFVSTGQEDFGF